ncbi:TMEM175 family protein [Tenacibaculum sp. 190524A02b]|uniref:TMEM175 family protein n=1 Tax=Tenacibaculum vairaonense TaxID=3137860 RepID=UPI0031FAF911
MTSERLEAFSDGVLAIIITVMVLELKPPHETTIVALLGKFPVFISYLVSFLYVSIYWNHHHQLFKIAEKIDGKILWANLNLLFWLSLIPFTTSWVGDNHIDDIPVALYGIVLLFSEVSFLLLKNTIVKCHGKTSRVSEHLNKNGKNTLFFGIHIIGLSIMCVNDYIPLVCFLIAGIVKVVELKKVYDYMHNQL